MVNTSKFSGDIYTSTASIAPYDPGVLVVDVNEGALGEIEEKRLWISLARPPGTIYVDGIENRFSERLGSGHELSKIAGIERWRGGD